MIVVNERKKAKKLLQNYKLESKRDINIITKHLFLDMEYSTDEIIEVVNDMDNPTEMPPMLMEAIVENTLAYRQYRQLEILDKPVSFTQRELDFILSYTPSRPNVQRVLFTFMVISKLYNNTFYYKKSEIIHFAKLPKNCQSYLEKIIMKLYADGILTTGLYKENYNPKKKKIRTHLTDEIIALANGEPVLTIETFNDDFVLYWMAYKGKKEVKFCKRCKCIFEKNGKRTICDDCR